MKKDSLEGKVITLYMDGGWEETGRVKLIDEEKIIIENEENLYMIFRSKISCLVIAKDGRAMSEATIPIAKIRSYDNQKADPVPRPTHADSLFPMNGMTYDDTSMSIPGTLLGESAKSFDEDLSVFYPGGSKISYAESTPESNISFSLEDDTKE